MKQLFYSQTFEVPAATLWYALWDHFSYCQWTSVFCEGSYAITDWLEGSDVLFLNPEGQGMYSKIIKCVPMESMFFKHLGVLKDGVPQPLDPESEKWSGAREEYTLLEENGKTTLKVRMETLDAYETYYNTIFPKALLALKELAENLKITVQTAVHKDLASVWELFTTPEHILQWNHASEDWHTTTATNNLTKGGKFTYRMEAKDGSFGFDMEGTYEQVTPLDSFCYKMVDGRVVTVRFSKEAEQTIISEVFDPETINALTLQRDGWQAILNTFKKYAER